VQLVVLALVIAFPALAAPRDEKLASGSGFLRAACSERTRSAYRAVEQRYRLDDQRCRLPPSSHASSSGENTALACASGS
jgi:hypothetical protein